MGSSRTIRVLNNGKWVKYTESQLKSFDLDKVKSIKRLLEANLAQVDYLRTRYMADNSVSTDVVMEKVARYNKAEIGIRFAISVVADIIGCVDAKGDRWLTEFYKAARDGLTSTVFNEICSAADDAYMEELA